MKNIIKTCNLTVRFSKFTFNIEIYKKFVEFLFKLVGEKNFIFHSTTEFKRKKKEKKRKEKKKRYGIHQSVLNEHQGE